ncbi:MAG: ABC transporter ATP-binding protein [Planctomycetota bacterium]
MHDSLPEPAYSDESSSDAVSQDAAPSEETQQNGAAVGEGVNPDAPTIEVESAERPAASSRKERRPLIEIKNLVKDYGDNVAVKNLSLTVGQGEIFGFIGPNGAGKTTTIRVLSTLLEPTSGEVFIDGRCVQNETDEVRRVVGYMPDSFGVYEGLTVEEYLEVFARAYRLSPKASKAIISDVMELTDLGHLRDRLVMTFSKGMKQRLCLAKTLIHDPKLLILDEPASALDPRARIELRMLLKELKEMGKTIFISSHILTELSDICTSAGVLETGTLVGQLDDLLDLEKEVDRVEIEFAREAPEALDLVERSPEVTKASLDETRLKFDYGGEPAEFHRVLKLLTDNQVPVVSVKHDSRNLEDLFLELTKGEVK